MVQTCRTEPAMVQTLVRSAHTGRWEASLKLILAKRMIMTRVGILTLLILFYIAPAFSQGLFESGNPQALSIGGFIRSTGYIGKTPDGESPYFQSAYGQAGLLLSAKAGSWAFAKADVRFRYGTEWQQEVSEFDIREVYVDLFAGPASFRFGKLISPWGKGTVFNPSEKITPLDPTFRSPDEDDMKLGFWGMQGSINMGPLMKLTGTWKPVYQSSVLLIDPVPMPDYVTFLEPDFPGVELKEGSYGLNFDLHASALDLSLYWFEGYSHWPGIAFDTLELDMESMEPTALNIFEKAYKISSLGMDLSVPLESWILRAEGAWQQTVDSNASHEYLPFPELSYTAEIERSGSYFTWIAGYHGKYILEYVPPAGDPSLSGGEDQLTELMKSGIQVTLEQIDDMIRGQIGAFNRLYNYQLEEVYHTAFTVLKGKVWQDQLELTLPIIYNVTTEEWIIQPGIAWLPYDGIRISAGYAGLFGPENSLYDLVGPVLNAGYLSFKLSF